MNYILFTEQHEFPVNVGKGKKSLGKNQNRQAVSLRFAVGRSLLGKRLRYNQPLDVKKSRLMLAASSQTRLRISPTMV